MCLLKGSAQTNGGSSVGEGVWLGPGVGVTVAGRTVGLTVEVAAGVLVAVGEAAAAQAESIRQKIARESPVNNFISSSLKSFDHVAAKAQGGIEFLNVGLPTARFLRPGFGKLICQFGRNV